MVKSSFSFAALLLLALMLIGCSEPEKVNAPVFVIKTPVMSISSIEFSEELDLKRAAYPYNIDENPAEYNEMVIHLVEVLSDELVLLSAAAQKGINVTDPELEAAEAEFKKDYPEDSFDQMLLKNAIPYIFWKKRFKRNMIMEKLVETELSGKIEITSQDIVSFYEKLKDRENINSNDGSGTGQAVGSETELVARLRMQKTQEEYGPWIQALWELYPVEINKDELKTFLIALENTKGSGNETKK